MPALRLRTLVLPLLLVAASAGRAESDVAWSFPSRLPPGGDVTALSLGRDGAVAAGGLRGAYAIADAGPPVARLRRGPVSDLVHRGDVLLAATAEGVYRAQGGRVVREHLMPGSTGVEVVRLAEARGVVAAATASGVFLRGAGARWRPVRPLPSRAAEVVALRPRGRDLELWCVIDGEPWVASIAPDGSIGFAQRPSLPSADRAERAIRVAFDTGGADVVLVYPTSLAVRRPDGGWRVLRPSLPPGARIVRLVSALDRLWLGTDAGLLRGRSLAGPWQRAAPPHGTTPVWDLVGDADALWVASRRGLVRGTRRAVQVAQSKLPAPAPDPAASEEPSVRELQRVALRYVDLHPDRVRALRRGVERRGWLPQLHFTVGYDRRDAHSRDDDQAFTSGATRDLIDRSRDRSDDVDFALTLSWDLGDIAYHPEAIDVVRESRALIALRDDVLDEVTQLYFERRRVLGALARLEGPSVEADSLALRADELASGLDAWTGGWFSRRLAGSSEAAGPE